MLHLRCGDDLRDKLRQAGIQGQYQAFLDPVCQGPIPAGVEGEAYLRQRAEFLTAYGGTAAEHYARLRADYAALRGFARQGEIVLWAEHDLYDQAFLVRLLDWFAPRNLKHVVLSLVQVDDYLGGCTAHRLREAFAARKPVTADQLLLGRLAWQALRHSDPRQITRLLARDLSVLPHLAPALKRHLAEFPGPDGLALTERLILQALTEGPLGREDLIRRYASQEPARWLGDAMVWAVVLGLCQGNQPAISLSDGQAALTAFGQALLRGEADWAAVNGLDRWVGGVKLSGTLPRIRWDGRALVKP